MLPRVIIHNSISLDGSLTGFQPDMELHYKIASDYKPEVHLIGSNTIKSGIELFGNRVPEETGNDFKKQNRDSQIPYWVIPDTKGILEGLLHTCRSFELCRDVIILVSEKTSSSYLAHLRERNYDYHVAGPDHVDLTAALSLLAEKYNARTILTDTGRILGNLLLNQGLVAELSLLVHPVIVGNQSYNMFSDIKSNIQLKLVQSEVLHQSFVRMIYKI